MRRFAEVAIRSELIAFHNICFRMGSSQDDRRDRLQAVILLDVSQNLAAIHFGEVQIQQDNIQASGMSVGPLMP